MHENGFGNALDAGLRSILFVEFLILLTEKPQQQGFWTNADFKETVFTRMQRADNSYDRGFRSIAFPCISTGKFRFPKRLAAETALSVIRAHDFAGEVVLCTHTDEEYAIYAECLGRSCDSSQ